MGSRSWLTLVLMAMFLLFLGGQFVTGTYETTPRSVIMARPAAAMSAYLATGHPWEALFENWESEFLQMAVFVLLTTVLVQKGSPESRGPVASEWSTPTRAISLPSPTRPGRSAAGAGAALTNTPGSRLHPALPVVSWAGHAAGGFAEYAAEEEMAATDSVSAIPGPASVLVRVVPELAERSSRSLRWSGCRSISGSDTHPNPNRSMLPHEETGHSPAMRSHALLALQMRP